MIVLPSITGAYCNVFQNVMGKQLRIMRSILQIFVNHGGLVEIVQQSSVMLCKLGSDAL